MAKKTKKRRFASRARKPKEKDTGFFERFKEVLTEPRRETVRMKTFIVEKPVYVPHEDNYRRPMAPSEKYKLEEEDYDRYASRSGRKFSVEDEEAPRKKKRVVEDEPLEDELQDSTEEFVDEADSADAAEFGEQMDDSEVEQAAEFGKGMKKVRSNAMVQSVWWKRAVLWGIFAWLIVLSIELIMQALQLIEVDLSRQWWVLLAGIIVVSLVYFRFFKEVI